MSLMVSCQRLSNQFQFLIGRLKIKLVMFASPEVIMFQFLIGRLKIDILYFLKITLLVFQFLIGRLKIKRIHG